MKLGIIVTIMGFAKKGFYHSQDIGLGKELVEEGNQVTIYKCVNHKEKLQYDRICSNLDIKYIPSMTFGVHGLLEVKYLDKSLEGILVFSDTQMFLKRIFNYCKLNNIAFVPYVGIAHSFQQDMKSKVMDIFFKLTTMKVYKKSEVIAKTVTAKNELQRLGASNVTVAPVGLDFERLNRNYESNDKVTIRREFNYDEKDVIISFIARLKQEKRPLDLINIFSSIIDKKNFKLLIVGDGPEKSKIEENITLLNIEDKVQLIPSVPYEDIWKIHYISDYFVNLRAEEIFGMAVMEGVFYKSAVAAINAPGPNTILDGMKGHALCKSYEEIVSFLCAEYPSENDLDESKMKLETQFIWKVCASTFINKVDNYKDKIRARDECLV